MHLAPLALLLEEIATLEACTRHAPHPRQRRRAQALLGRGQSVTQLATFYAVRYATVQGWPAWRTRWRA